MNTDPKTGKKKRASQSNCQGEKKGRWANKKHQKNKIGCGRYGHDHEIKDYPQATGAYFRCGENGHMIANCPQRAPQKQPQEIQKKRGEGSSQPQKTQGKLYNMTREGETNASDVVRGNEDNYLYQL